MGNEIDLGQRLFGAYGKTAQAASSAIRRGTVVAASSGGYVEVLFDESADPVLIFCEGEYAEGQRMDVVYIDGEYAIMGGGGSNGVDSVEKLPDGYVEVEYLESTGTQYINTEVHPSDNSYRVALKFRYTVSHSGLSLFGNSTSRPYSVTVYGSRPTFYVGDQAGISIGPQTDIGVDYALDVTASDGKVSAVWNGEEHTASYSKPFFTGRPVFVFGSNAGGYLAESTGGYRLYYFQMYNDGALVRDFLPCISPEGMPGLYDLVDGRFYKNAGSGKFVTGPVINDALPIADGGTGATTAEDALANLGAAAAEHTHDQYLPDAHNSDTEAHADIRQAAANAYSIANNTRALAGDAYNLGIAARDRLDAMGPIPDVDEKVATHNADATAHADIREAAANAYSIANNTRALAGDAYNLGNAAKTAAATAQATADSAVPSTRKVNGKALSADISLTASDVGAAPSGHSHSEYALKTEVPSITYGTSDLTAGTSALATGAMYLVYE